MKINYNTFFWYFTHKKYKVRDALQLYPEQEVRELNLELHPDKVRDALQLYPEQEARELNLELHPEKARDALDLQLYPELTTELYQKSEKHEI